MLRSSLSCVLSEKVSQILPVQYQILRWKRKPRKPFWIGTAKSKKFRIPEHPVLPPEEDNELKRLHNNYKTALKSIRHFYKTLAVTHANSSAETVQLVNQEVIDASMKTNDAWNAECARLRAERIAREEAEHEDIVLDAVTRREEQNRIMMEKIEEHVRFEKEQSKNFVTRENLDAKIEECLNSLTDYNYAIDLEGNVYTGFEADMKMISKKIPESEENVAQSN